MAINLDKYAGASKWLKAEDLTRQDMDAAIVTICEVFEETFPAREGKPAEDKLALRFKEFDKPLMLNVTNTKSMIAIHGDDADDWDGKKIKLRVSTANNPNTGEPVDCLRIAEVPKPKKIGAAVMAKSAKSADEADDPYADE